MSNRKAISKKDRFEVFKRDSFKCQYCGASAPDVLLHIDHIKPVSKGGTNNLTNLITACVSCNSGKSNRTLDDKTAVKKQRDQLEDLQERREQLEMMMTWAEGMRNINDETVDKLCGYWHDLAPGWSVNDTGKNNMKRWLRKFTLDEITKAMDIAAEQYLEFEDDGRVTSESWENGFSKIAGICRVERMSKDDPDIKDLYYIRGIARKKCEYYFNNAEALEMLKIARSYDVPMQELREIAYNSTSWTKFRNGIYKAIDFQESIQNN